MSPSWTQINENTITIVHGEADNNPAHIANRRYFQALKGLGAPTRMVILPKEAHSYVAKKIFCIFYGNKINFRKIFEKLVEKASKLNLGLFLLNH
jgi:dipeptidyl aminopeptidase/acylaminoacyl peptidase